MEIHRTPAGVAAALFLVLVASCSDQNAGSSQKDGGPGHNKACKTNADCPAGSICVGGYCNALSQGLCASNADCNGGVCNLVTYKCAPVADAGSPADAAADTESPSDTQIGPDAGGDDVAPFDSGEDTGVGHDAGFDAGESPDAGGGDTGSPGSCVTNCECKQGYYCDQGSGTCQYSSARQYYCCDKAGCPAGRSCLHTSGMLDFCAGAGGSCTVSCDCPQGMKCTLGHCVAGTPPTYCCDKLGCEKGAGCVNRYDQQGVCPDMAGWECLFPCDCQQQHVDCKDHMCTADDTILFCCELANCTKGQECIRNDGITHDICGTCDVDCDCPQGYPCLGNECIMAFESPYYCCDKAGCPAGESCTGKDDSLGDCKGTAGKCFADCDCPQGKTCNNGACEENLRLPSYCCDRPNCPEYDQCTDVWGNPGACPKVQL